jgi:coniferyl-aldehyde dehydrogenase
LLERGKMQEFADRFVAEAERFYPARKEAQNYTSLVGARALDRLRDGIEECKSRGARILSADARLAEKGNSLAPTVVLDAPGDCRLMQDEIFGPVLPLVAYDDLNQALDFVNDRPRPLALYGFSHDKEVQDKIVRETVSGNVTINGTLVHIAQNDLPFGGVGPSGIGAYHGREGFVRFSHAKGIAKVRLFDPTRLLTPPYGAVAKILAKFMTR